MMRSNEDRRTGKDSERVSSRAARRSALPTPCACGGRCDDSHGAGARGPVTCDWSWLGGHCTASPSGACKAATASRALLNLSNESRRGGNELQRSLPLSSAEGSAACGGVVAGERGIAQGLHGAPATGAARGHHCAARETVLCTLVFSQKQKKKRPFGINGLFDSVTKPRQSPKMHSKKHRSRCS